MKFHQRPEVNLLMTLLQRKRRKKRRHDNQQDDCGTQLVVHKSDGLTNAGEDQTDFACHRLRKSFQS